MMNVNTGPVKAVEHRANALAVVQAHANQRRDTMLVSCYNRHHKLFVKIQLSNFTGQQACVVEFCKQHGLKLVVLLPDGPHQAAERKKH
jgi:hypothetical protein